MAALYTAIKLHLMMAKRGPEEVRKAQVARGVLERIGRDVRATIAPAAQASATPAPAGGGAGEPAAGGIDPEDEAAGAPAAQPDPYRAASGLWGGSDWIELYMTELRPNLDNAEAASSSGAVAQASSVLRVSYALTPLATRPDAAGRTIRLGIARSEVASIAAERLDSGTDESDYRASTEFLCDDAGELQFQYWDDSAGTWVDTWGIDAPTAPPRAVRVFISLLEPDQYQGQRLGLSGGGQSTWTPNFQLVIAIPTWSPDTAASGGTAEDATGGR